MPSSICTKVKVPRHLIASTIVAIAFVVILCWSLAARRFAPSPERTPFALAEEGSSSKPVMVPELAPFSEVAGDELLSFHQRRLRADPDDIVSLNAVAAEALKRLRLTGNLRWLQDARVATERSLRSVPSESNLEALRNEARVETEYHHFARARDLARSLCQLQPSDPAGSEILGDALVELGEYDSAASTYHDLRKLFPERQVPPPEVAVRLARLDWINGDVGSSVGTYSAALATSERSAPGFVEMRAFCLVQLGQLAFERGDWRAARSNYTQALAILPSYFPAYEHLAEVTGAEGNGALAIAMYERLIQQIDRPEFAQMLADLYLYNRSSAAGEYWRRRAERAYQASVAGGDTFYLHNLVSFYCDTLLEPAKAVYYARLDLENVHSVFAFEALGWALYRSGDYPAAQRAFDRATLLKTPSAHLDYEAGTVYFRAGSYQKGQTFLRAAYALNPAFRAFHVHR